MKIGEILLRQVGLHLIYLVDMLGKYMRLLSWEFRLMPTIQPSHVWNLTLGDDVVYNATTHTIQEYGHIDMNQKISIKRSREFVWWISPTQYYQNQSMVFLKNKNKKKQKKTSFF
jgi:hypothetical protein